MYIYPEHLKARAVMWLWQLRDLTIDWGGGFVFCAWRSVQTGVIIPALFTAAYAFLTIRFEDTSILDLSAMPVPIFSDSNFLNGG